MREPTVEQVLLLYGGRSSEHEVSCLSARSVLEVIDRERYEVVPVGITRDGRWTLTDGRIEAPPGRPLPEVGDQGPTVALVGTRNGAQLVRVDEGDAGGDATARLLGPVDVAFPLLHGPWGEDGTVQGLLASVGCRYVGADATASSIGIDKGAMKAAFAAAGLPQDPYVTVHQTAWASDPERVRAELAELRFPWFCKPARQGSSIGIRKVHELAELDDALAEALSYDKVAVVEQGVEGGRELEVGVLGEDDEVEVTAPGEIRPSHEFYDFEAKYLDGSELVVPADLDAALADEIGEVARAAYRAIGCRGLARVDFFVHADGRVVVNEINTIPGFTPNSMFPRLWDAAGVAYGALVDRLLASARA